MQASVKDLQARVKQTQLWFLLLAPVCRVSEPCIVYRHTFEGPMALQVENIGDGKRVFHEMMDPHECLGVPCLRVPCLSESVRLIWRECRSSRDKTR